MTSVARIRNSKTVCKTLFFNPSLALNEGLGVKFGQLENSLSGEYTRSDPKVSEEPRISLWRKQKELIFESILDARDWRMREAGKQDRIARSVPTNQSLELARGWLR